MKSIFLVVNNIMESIVIAGERQGRAAVPKVDNNGNLKVALGSGGTAGQTFTINEAKLFHK